jgi:DNA-binding XRE family transcriptional regulator
MMAARKRKTLSKYIAERREHDAEFAEEFDKLQLARKMRELREKAGLSQAQLAARVGTQAPGIARIERGRFAPRLDVLHRIAAALGKRVRIHFDSTHSRGQVANPLERGQARANSPGKSGRVRGA